MGGLMDDVPGEYLAQTELCDWNDGEVSDLAAKIRKGSTDDRAYAINAFYWVRDNVFYAMDSDLPWKASDTLVLRRGNCWSKSNLLVALCRASGIPAKFQVQYITGEATRDITPHFGVALNYRITHTAALISLNNRWVRADCTRDRGLPRACDFDGHNDTPQHPFLVKNGPTIADLKDVYEQQERRNRRMRRLSVFVGLLMMAEWGSCMWNIDMDEVRFKNSGIRAISDEEASELCEKIYERTYEQFRIKHRGDIRVGIFVCNRLGSFSGMKGGMRRVSKDRCEISGDRVFRAGATERSPA
jgi:hypothetical protein